MSAVRFFILQISLLFYSVIYNLFKSDTFKEETANYFRKLNCDLIMKNCITKKRKIYDRLIRAMRKYKH